MMATGFSFHYEKGALARNIEAAINPVAEAATGAMHVVVDDAKLKARAEIAAAGFSTKWQNALRGVVYPKNRVSPGPAGHIYHKIGYAGVFEDGATIRGNPYLWIPFSGVPPRLGRSRMSPSLFIGRVGPLHSASFHGLPVLVAPMAVTQAEAKRGRDFKVTLAKLRRGASGGGTVRDVPIFFGRKSVKMPDRLSIGQIAERAGDRLVAEFAAQFDRVQ